MAFQISRFALCGTAAAMLFAGCSGGGTSLPTANSAQAPSPLTPQSVVRHSAEGVSFVVDPLTGRVGPAATVLSSTRQTSPGWLSADAVDATVAKAYISDDVANAVDIFKTANPSKPIGTITNGINGPLGSFIDSMGTLYVTNVNSNTLTVYPKGKTAPSLTYSTGLTQPISVAVGTDGTVYVSEFGPGMVVEYDKGKTKPSRTITINEPEGVTLDAKNKLYVSFNNSSGVGDVETFAPKSTTGKDLGLTGISFAGDLRVNTAGDIIVGDQVKQTVDFFKPGATTSYGSIAVGADTYKLALSANESLLYVADAAIAVDIFDAVPSGKMTGSITDTLESATGVSLSPAAP